MSSSSTPRALEWFIAIGALFVLSDALDRAFHSVSSATASVPLARAIVIPFFAAALLVLVNKVLAAGRAKPGQPDPHLSAPPRRTRG